MKPVLFSGRLARKRGFQRQSLALKQVPRLMGIANDTSFQGRYCIAAQGRPPPKATE